MPKPSDPPEQGAASTDEERFSVTLDRRTYEMCEFLAQHWNAIDKVRQRKRYRDWGVTNVCPPLVRAAVSNVLAAMGGYPQIRSEQREVMIREAVDVFREMSPRSDEDFRGKAEELVDMTIREFDEAKGKRQAREVKKRRK